VAIPPIYFLDQLAQRWGIAPWQITLDDPEVRRWVQRGRVFLSLEAQAQKVHKIG
jgi:hypothetical protein